MIASLNGLGLRLSGDGRRPLRICSKPSAALDAGKEPSGQAVIGSISIHDKQPRTAFGQGEGEVGYEDGFASACDWRHNSQR